MASRLDEVIASRKLNEATKALSQLADQLRYQLPPPHTNVLYFKAREENDRFIIELQARLYLHYSSLEKIVEGLIFTIQFKGETIADTPNRPIDELFYVGTTDSLLTYGYGPRWKGKRESVDRAIAEHLEVPYQELVLVDLEELRKQIQEKS